MRSDCTKMGDFHNERPGNLLHWRIVENDYRKSKGEPPFFVYRVVEGASGVPITEYLWKDGRVDSTCGSEGSFRDYAEVGMALALFEGRSAAAGSDGVYTEAYRTWMEARREPATT